MLSVEFFILGNHALLVYEHLVEVLELLRQEDCLIANDRVNAIQVLQIKVMVRSYKYVNDGA